MKKLLFAGSFGIMMFGGVAFAENEATYNASTGVLNIPKVSVGSDYYNVNMQQQTGLNFLVTGAAASVSTSSSNIATYNATAGTLNIPTVIVGADMYTVDMTQGQGVIFSVTGVTVPSAQSAVFRIPDTGQTKCYDNTSEITCPSPGQPFYGQDGSYTINPMQYTATNGVVTDHVTGLEWQQTSDDTRRNWDEANSYCAVPPLDGGGWRMPSKHELLSLVDYSITQNLTINGLFSASLSEETTA